MKKTILAALFLVTLAVASRDGTPTAAAAVSPAALPENCVAVSLCTGGTFSTLRQCRATCASCDVICF